MVTYKPLTPPVDASLHRGMIERVKLSGPADATEQTEWVAWPSGDQLQLAAQTAVPITTSDTAQTVVNAQPAGTTFVVRAGTHTAFTLALTSAHDGDRFIFEPGAILDRGNAAAKCITGTAKDVVIRGWSNTQRVSIKNYKPTVAASTIMGPVDTSDDSRNVYPGWEMGFFDMLDCNKVNVRLGPGNWLHHASITNAGTLGIGGGGRSSPLKPTIVEYVTITTANSESSAPGDEGAYTKFAVCNNIEIRHCALVGSATHTPGNYFDAYGWWFDVDVWNYNIHHCTANNLPRAGLIAEISGGGRISQCTFSNGGYKYDINNLNTWGSGNGAGIQICSSGRSPFGGDGILVEENTISAYNEGIVIWEQARGLWQNYPMFDHFSTDVTVVRNTISGTGGSGVATDISAWSSATAYVGPGTGPEYYDASHVEHSSNNYRALANNTNSAPTGTTADNANWHYVSPGAFVAGRRLRWDKNTYTSYTVTPGSPGAFYYNRGGRNFAYWQATALQDTHGSYTA